MTADDSTTASSIRSRRTRKAVAYEEYDYDDSEKTADEEDIEIEPEDFVDDTPAKAKKRVAHGGKLKKKSPTKPSVKPTIKSDEALSSMENNEDGDRNGSHTEKKKVQKKGDVKKAVNAKLPKTKEEQQAGDGKTKSTAKFPPYDPKAVAELAKEYPDNYWAFSTDNGHNMIDEINAENPLKLIPRDIRDQAPITGISLSVDGRLLLTFCNIGTVRIWDIENDFKMLRSLRDQNEKNIDEFFCGRFTPNMENIVVAGKLKDRTRWSVEDDDNHILPCPLKIFDLRNETVVAKLEGHSEEILCIKSLTFKGENYYISTSQDGYIIKWKMAENWTTLLENTRVADGITCMAFTVSFVPNTGNKYFVGACDGHVKVYDFENAQVLQTFEDLYSSYCDCGKFINWLDEDIHHQGIGGDMDDKENFKDTGENKKVKRRGAVKKENGYAWLITRGAELCDLQDGTTSTPNTCTLHKLIYPEKKGNQFKLEEVKRFKHEKYFSNSWMVKIASNGRYLLAPTLHGEIFVFNILTGKITAILKDHDDLEVRDIVFHPYLPLLFTSADDGCVKVYTYANDGGEIDDCVPDKVDQPMDIDE